MAATASRGDDFLKTISPRRVATVTHQVNKMADGYEPAATKENRTMDTLEQNVNQSSQTPPATPAPQPTIGELRTKRAELSEQLDDINYRLKPIERRERLVEFALLKRVFGKRHRLEIKIGFQSNGKETRADVNIFTDESAPLHLSISPKMSRAEACGCLLKIIASIESEHGEQLWQRTAEVTKTVLSDANFPEVEYSGDDDVPF